MINQYIHVFVQLVASRRALGHGVGYSHVGCHVELVKIAQNPLERVTDHVSGLCSQTGAGVMSSFWHASISLSSCSRGMRFASLASG